MKRFRTCFCLVVFSALYFITTGAAWAQGQPVSSNVIRLLDNNHIPQKVLVVLSDTSYGNNHIDTGPMVKKLVEIVKEINTSGQLSGNDFIKVYIVIGNDASLKNLNLSSEDIEKYVEVCNFLHTDDIWMQDWGEICAVEKNGTLINAIFDSKRGGGIGGKFPALFAESASMPYFSNPNSSGECGDYGGNIEVTPDNIFFAGNTMSDACRNFFAKNGYENRQVMLDTSWLDVGHIDEYMMVIPTAHSACGYSIVRSDPWYALDLIKTAADSDFEALPTEYKTSMLEIRAALNDPESYKGSDVQQMIDLNRTIGEIIDQNIGKFMQEVRRISGDSEREFPVVAWPNLYIGNSGSKPNRCSAFLPGVVNLLVLRDHLVVPATHFPPFEKIIEARFRSQGNKVHFIDEYMYHDLLGEVHCGTNVLRDPNRVIVTPKAISAITMTKNTFERVHSVNEAVK